MIVVSKNYSKQIGIHGSMAFFDIIAETAKELKSFWKSYKDILDHPVLHDFELSSLKIAFKDTNNLKEKITNLVYRHNVVESGNRLQLEKKEFLERFALEATKAIIYATDFCPKDIDIDEYAGVFMASHEDYGDGSGFDNRVINVSGAKSGQDLGVVSDQIRLFKQLMSVYIDQINGTEQFDENYNEET